jgi:hypothetical protein
MLAWLKIQVLVRNKLWLVNMPRLPSFPRAQQAQISPSSVYTSLALLTYFPVRANQRDVYHISSLKEETENVFRNFLGTRWLARWDKELDLLVKLLYYCLTTGRGKCLLFSIHAFSYTVITSLSHPNARRRVHRYLAVFKHSAALPTAWPATPGVDSAINVAPVPNCEMESCSAVLLSLAYCSRFSITRGTFCRL